MKKIFSILCVLLISINTFAQQSNYSGSSRFTDNWSVTLQGGVITPLSDFFSGHTACAPIVLVGADKYITNWFGAGADFRTKIETGCVAHNSHVVFDKINVSGYAKFNLANIFAYNGTRHIFEPVLYTGIGWGHATCSKNTLTNYMSFRSGVEFNFNFGKERSVAVVVNPSVVFGDIDNGRLAKSRGNFELTAGVVYHFKTSNGTHSFTKAKLYDQAQIDLLNQKVDDLKELNKSKDETISAQKELIKAIKRDTVYVTAPTTTTSKFYFEKNSIRLTGDVDYLASSLKESGATCVVIGYASKEGSDKVNDKLAERRAMVLKQALVKAGVDAAKIKVSCGGATDKFSKTSLEPNRVAVVEK